MSFVTAILILAAGWIERTSKLFSARARAVIRFFCTHEVRVSFCSGRLKTGGAKTFPLRLCLRCAFNRTRLSVRLLCK